MDPKTPEILGKDGSGQLQSLITEYELERLRRKLKSFRKTADDAQSR